MTSPSGGWLKSGDFSYPPVRETVDATLREVNRCTRDGIRINTFMLDASGYLKAFVEKLTQLNRGRAFFTTPETLGDYVGGPNHVLPTSGAARFSSGLGVLDFLKRTSILECGPANFPVLAKPAIDLARAEGLDAHARAVELRLNALNDGSAHER